MKRANYLIGLASALAMSTANAASIYEKDGFSYQIKGDWQIQLRQDTGVDEDLDVEFDDLELKNRVEYQVEEGYKFFGQLDYSFNGAADDSSTSSSSLEEAYAGVSIGNTSISMGKRVLATDRFGYELALEAPGTQEDVFAINGNDGDDVIHLATKIGKVNIEIATELDADSENTGGESSSDIFVETTLGAATITFGYEIGEEDQGDYVESTEAAGLGISLKTGFGKLIVDYSTIEYELDSTQSTTVTTDDDVNTQDRSIINFGGVFKVAPTTNISVGTIVTEFENNSDADFTAYYANIEYKVPSQKNVRLFAEIADNDMDDTEIGYLAGIRLLF